MKTSIAILFFTGISIFSAQGGSFNIPTLWPQVTDIHVIQKGAVISISWKADAEVKDMNYVVERGTDGVHFTTAAVLLGGFESGKQFSYEFREKVKNTKYTYRIKQLKQDGSFHIAAERTL